MQNGRLRGSFKAEHLNKCVMSHGPFGQQLQVLWLCDDHERIINKWNTKNLTDLEAVQRGSFPLHAAPERRLLRPKRLQQRRW